MIWKRVAALAIPLIALAINAPGMARGEVVTNGNFMSLTNGFGQLGNVGTTNADSWSVVNGYNFVVDPTDNQLGLKFWGSPGASPGGGNYVALGDDPAIGTSPIQQTLTGLIAGDAYVVSFYWAGAQQAGGQGATTDELNVSLGSQTESTGVVNNSAESFTGWMYETLTFTAISTSEVLSVSAVGSPSGGSSFALLSDVMAFAVPEPCTVSLMGTGLLIFAAASLRRRARAKPATI